MITYKGYIGAVNFDPEIDLFHGTVINTTDVRINISPRWGLPGVGYGVSINISPRWGYPVVHPSLFFESCVCVRNLEKNQKYLKNKG